ncbi:DUF106 domain-containing protein [Candidatus Woesearchaeota archaeon]|nr:DUF106 domain-containing protein [Candidatus Woesearchaeota archaeon]
MVFESILNPLFSPLLALDPLYFILIMSFLVSLLITLVYKWMTDQVLMKELKDKLKEHQQKMKEHKGDTKKVLELQKSAMDLNMKYMLHSLKPTLVTFLPIIIIFGWLANTIAYEPLLPNQQFSAALTFVDGISGNVQVDVPQGVRVTGNSTKTIEGGKTEFTFKGEEGDYLLVFTVNEKSFEKEVSITSQQKYAPVTKTFRNEPIKTVTLSNTKLIVLNLFGWKLGWLGAYIITSIVFSMGLRKLMKLH